MQNNTLQVLNALQKTIAAHQMSAPGETVLVGVSGGADSVCLLHALKTLQKELEIHLAAAHLNHGIRGEEADRDAAFVKNLCETWQIPYYERKEDIPALAKAMEVSEETAGRLARYQFFQELCREKGFDRIATAHNRDDQAETVLMRVIRGTGMEGLSGIRYVRQDGVIRPLLDVERTQIEGYCQENNLTYCTDSTNQEDTYTRNRIRHRLLPLLKAEFNPNITGALAALAQNMAEDGDFLKGYANRLYRRINNPAPSHKPILLDMETLELVQESIRSRLILLATQDAMGKDYRLERCHMEAVFGLLGKETGTAVTLPKGLCAVVRYGWIAFETPEEQARLAGTDFADGLHYEVELGRAYDVGDHSVTLELKELPVNLQENQMLLDYDKVKELPLEIRTRRRGDRIAVFKDGRERKLKDFLIDAKIPLRERGSIPLLCSGSKVIAVIGHRIAEPYKANKETKRGLVIHNG